MNFSAGVKKISAENIAAKKDAVVLYFKIHKLAYVRCWIPA
jgi:hypothetical protein